MPFDPATIVFGALVGLSLGLTGSGGSILAIPLLVYGVGLAVQDALPVSLLMVAAIAAFGAVRQTAAGAVNWRAAILFSLTGMMVSPLVVTATHDANETLRLVLFALLMLFVAVRMILPRRAAVHPAHRTRYAALPMAAGGVAAGALSGFFGVGGGFIIIPLLSLIFAMPYKIAVGTSLACIALISSAALAGQFVAGATFDLALVLPFVGGGLLGLLVGTALVNRIDEKISKRVFAGITILLALFMLIDKLLLTPGGLS